MLFQSISRASPAMGNVNFQTLAHQRRLLMFDSLKNFVSVSSFAPLPRSALPIFLQGCLEAMPAPLKCACLTIQFTHTESGCVCCQRSETMSAGHLRLPNANHPRSNLLTNSITIKESRPGRVEQVNTASGGGKINTARRRWVRVLTEPR